MKRTHKRGVLGTVALLGLGMLGLGAQPAQADYRYHNHGCSCREVRYHRVYDFGYDRYDRYDRYRDDFRYRRYYGNDWDRDGVPTRWDRDRDNDGIRNRYDRDKDGDRVPNWRDRNDRNPRRR